MALWVALPPELENGPNASHYVMPDEVPEQGPVRVILGEYRGVKSPIATPPMTYLVVSLEDGERWTYQPPRGHDVAWVAVSDGLLRTSAAIPAGEIAIFEPSEESVDFLADGATRFVIGSAPKHPHDLVLGNYSVHTSAEALQRGEAEIRRVLSDVGVERQRGIPAVQHGPLDVQRQPQADSRLRAVTAAAVGRRCPLRART